MSEKETLIIYADSSVAPNNNGGVGVRIIAIDDDRNVVIYDSSHIGSPNAITRIFEKYYSLQNVIRKPSKILARHKNL